MIHLILRAISIGILYVLLSFQLSFAGEGSQCKVVPMVRILSDPIAYEGHLLMLTGVLKYEDGLVKALFMDDFSNQNYIVENSIKILRLHGLDKLATANNRIVSLCGVLGVEAPYGAEPMAVFKEVLSARYQNGIFYEREEKNSIKEVIDLAR